MIGDLARAGSPRKCAWFDDTPARDMVLLSTPVDTRRSLYVNWVGRDWFDVD